VQSNGQDRAHADCDGNGIINANDTLAIVQNFGLVGAANPDEIEQRSLTAAEVHFVPQQSTYYAGDTVKIHVMAGDAVNPYNNLLGAAWTLPISSNYIQSNSVKFYYNNSTSNAIPAPGLPGQQRNGPTTYNWGPNLADLYLMMAECKARGGDLSGAKTDLETLRKNRMLLAEATVTLTTQDALVKIILDERQREFAGTGWRWFDMRRLVNDSKYNNIDPTHPLDGTIYNLTPERLTMKIPPAILKLNPGMPNNQ
jgi:hypothetical protein